MKIEYLIVFVLAFFFASCSEEGKSDSYKENFVINEITKNRILISDNDKSYALSFGESEGDVNISFIPSNGESTIDITFDKEKNKFSRIVMTSIEGTNSNSVNLLEN